MITQQPTYMFPRQRMSLSHELARKGTERTESKGGEVEDKDVFSVFLKPGVVDIDIVFTTSRQHLELRQQQQQVPVPPTPKANQYMVPPNKVL